MIGEGRLVLDFVNHSVNDGVNFFIPLSLSLKRKLKRHKNRQDGVDGKWLAIGRFIVMFWKP